MNSYQPGNWGRQIVRVSLLLLAIAVAARVTYELLLPLLPAILTALVLGALMLATVSRWRR